jgi:hypothetical protein
VRCKRAKRENWRGEFLPPSHIFSLHFLLAIKMAAVVEEKLAPVDARFINRTVVGTTTANIVKAAVWGNAFALSQAFGACAIPLAPFSLFAPARRRPAPRPPRALPPSSWGLAPAASCSHARSPSPPPPRAGWAFYELRATAKASGKAISIQEFTKLGGSKLRVFWPSIVACVHRWTGARGRTRRGAGAPAAAASGVARRTHSQCFPSSLPPSLLARRHTAFFAAYRGNSADTIGIGGLIKPLLVTSLPTLGYAAYTRAMPPQFLTFSIASCVGLHIYDRHMNAKGLHTEHMPIGHMNRRVF